MADEEDKIYALVSAAAYCRTPQENIEKYNLIYNTEKMVVYQHDNEFIYGFRGSYDGKDFFTNIAMGVRGVENTSRYKTDLEDYIEHKLSNCYKKPRTDKRRQTVYEIGFSTTLTGHSLGGSIAIALYKTIYNKPDYNSKCVVFDPYLPINQKNFIPKDINKVNIKIYRIKGDKVSVNVDENSNDYLVENLEKMDPKKNVHSLHQFVDYKDEGDVCMQAKEYEEMVMRF